MFEKRQRLLGSREVVTFIEDGGAPSAAVCAYVIPNWRVINHLTGAKLIDLDPIEETPAQEGGVLYTQNEDLNQRCRIQYAFCHSFCDLEWSAAFVGDEQPRRSFWINGRANGDI